MSKAVFTVPKMWADHHVLKVREALTGLNGVQDLYASSAWKQVMVEYDPDDLDEAAIAATLAEAGYKVDEAFEWESEPLEGGDPAWERLDVRVTKTNERDLTLSGEFRRY
jgi:copper chaperone CopZ